MERSEYTILSAVEDRHWWHGGMRAVAAALLDPIYGGRRARILDAGCGVGGNARFLARYGEVVALDVAREALELAAPALGGRLVGGSALALPFADNSFDLVTSFDVLYHRAVPDEAPALAEARRVLRPGGRLLVRLPAYEFLRSKHDRAVHTRRRYTAEEVAAILKAGGFYVERLSYVLTTLFPLALAQRLVEKALPALERGDSDLSLPSGPVNSLMRVPMAAEAAYLAMGGSLPLGLSVVALANAGKLQRLVPTPAPRRRRKEEVAPR